MLKSKLSNIGWEWKDTIDEYYGALNTPEGAISPKEMGVAASTHRKLRLQQTFS